jgi:hypothetical protein
MGAAFIALLLMNAVCVRREASGRDAAVEQTSAPGCPYICPSHNEFCIGCGRGKISSYLGLDSVCTPECTPPDIMGSLWRNAGLDKAEVARCLIDAAPEAEHYTSQGLPYLSVKVHFDVGKSGDVVASDVTLDRGLSSEEGRSRWPQAGPGITRCLEKVLRPMRIKGGRPIEASKATLRVQVSKMTKDEDDWPEFLKKK